MRKGFLCVAGLMLSAIALADGGNMSLKWDQPMVYDDGNKMVQADIESFELHYTVDSTFKAMTKPIVIKPDQRSYELVLNLPRKLVPYVVSMALRTKDIYGGVSSFSNVIVSTFTVQSTAVPSAPVNIRLNITCDETCKIVDSKIETIK